MPLEQFLLPMALASDAVVTDGEMIGDPTEGALVVLAEKGGLDVAATRERYPRVAELPFDSEYKLMATFHRMQDESGHGRRPCFVKGAPDQLLARSSTHLGPDLEHSPTSTTRSGSATSTRTSGSASRACACMATARKDFDPRDVRPERRPAAARWTA